MADQSREPAKEPTRQADGIELAQARTLRIRRETHPLEDWRDMHVQIDREALNGWLGVSTSRRASDAPAPTQRCSHCRRYPISPLEWRPWHPLMALLCSKCRSEVYVFAEAIALRMGHRVNEHLGEVLAILHLGE